MNITIKLTAALVIVAGCALAGRSMAGAQARRAQVLKELAEAVARLRFFMLTQRLPLAEALASAEHPLMLEMARVMREQSGRPVSELFSELYPALSARGMSLDSLLAEDQAALQALFDQLGTGGVAAQEALLQAAEESLARLTEKARARREEQGKLYTSLGALFGIALAVMLI